MADTGKKHLQVLRSILPIYYLQNPYFLAEFICFSDPNSQRAPKEFLKNFGWRSLTYTNQIVLIEGFSISSVGILQQMRAEFLKNSEYRPES